VSNSVIDAAYLDQLGLAGSVVDPESLERSLQRFRERRIVLPTFAQLANPSMIDQNGRIRMKNTSSQSLPTRNLWTSRLGPHGDVNQTWRTARRRASRTSGSISMAYIVHATSAASFEKVNFGVNDPRFFG